LTCVTPREHVPIDAGGFDVTETVPRRLETLAVQAPERLALKGKDTAFSYGELNAYANGVARLLAPVSSTGDRVVLYLGTGARIVGAMMGALKAETIYVPVDPAFPAARNRMILADADAAVILTDSVNFPGAERIADGRQKIISLDDEAISLASGNATRPVAPESPACLVYTSGSTGKPKGVIHTHQSLLHDGYRRAILQKITSEDRMTLLYSASVMGAAHGIFTSLTCGAALYANSLRDESVRGLIDWIRDGEITVYHSVATVFRLLVSNLRAGESLPHVRLVILGGERVLRSDLECVWRWFSRECKVFAGLGSTEVGTVRGWLLDRDTPFEGDVVPSGYPAPGTDVGVVTETGEGAAVGQTGEITVTSPFISRGYWQDPESTKKVLNQDAGDPRVLTYRTGDLGVLLPGGQLLAKGRKDSQVTIGGFRVETGEVEHALLSHPAVMHVAAVGQGRETGTPALAAFVVVKPGTGICLAEVRSHAQERLPGHMVPTHYALLDELPRTPNGKTDYRLLETRELSPFSDADCQAGPRDELDASLAYVFATAFDGRQVGIHANLFDAGLTSLMAVRALTGIERELGCRVPLKTLFEAPTIASLAARLRDDVSLDAHASVVVINPDGPRPPVFCLPGIGGVASFTYRRLADYVGQDQPFHALQVQGLDAEAPVHRSVEEMAAHHIAVMRNAQETGPYYLVGYSFGGRLAFEMAQQLRASGQEVALLALLDTFAPGYPKIAPLPVRCGLHLRNLVRMTPRERALYMKERAGKVLQRFTGLSQRFQPSETDEAPDVSGLTLDERIERVRQITGRASERYRPRAYPGEIEVFRSAERPKWLGASFDDPQNGWGAYTYGAVHVRLLPGAHLDMMRPPGVAVLGRELRACLDEAMGA
jgi:amino acid adenylation domain-containing protein